MRAAFLFAMICAGAVVAPAELRIGIIGDQTGAAFGEDPYPVLAKAVQRLKPLQPDVVLHTGDLLESVEYGAQGAQPMAAEAYQQAYARATGILDGLPCPWYLAAGDHDVTAPYDQPGQTVVRLLFQRLYAARVPAVRERLYYSFNRAGYHFIALSSQEAHNTDPRWGSTFRARISTAQQQWLQTDLQQARRAKGVIVFLHQPLWYQWADWAPVHALLRQHHVRAVIAGHFHYNQDEGELDGIRYLVVGAAGAAVKRGSAVAGHLHHATLLRLSGRTVQAELLRLDAAEPGRFSSRRDMDRVQALALNLGNVFADTSEMANAVTLQEGTVRSCAGNASPSFSFASLGNPLDVPVTLQIVANPGNFPPARMAFRPGACLAGNGVTECVLPPGEGIEAANNSLVVPRHKPCSAPGPPLWTATFPAATLDGRPPSFSLVLRMSFIGEAGELVLEQPVALATTCPARPACRAAP